MKNTDVDLCAGTCLAETGCNFARINVDKTDTECLIYISASFTDPPGIAGYDPAYGQWDFIHVGMCSA